MLDFTEVEELLEKIDVEKEILATMPKNNAKNIEKYLEKITNLKNDYGELQENIYEILTKRYKKATDLKEDKGIENLNIRIKTIEDILYLLNKEKTSYEKMELDKIIYKIGKYYKENLDNINIQIEKAIQQFYKVGINLELSDFEYSIYVKQYMKVFFEERKKGDINSSRIKEKFEEIYWKCPDIIVHIELNIRNIYLKNQSQIDKYFEKEKNVLLKKWDKMPNEIKNLYFEIKEQREELLFKDKKNILDSFLDGKLNINDYAEEKMQNNYAQILSPTRINGIEINQEEIERGILGLLNSLYEYKNYLSFKFIIDDIKIHFEEKEKYKKIYEETLKKIIANEKKLKKMNKKASMTGLFGKKKKEVKLSAEQNQLIDELKKDYKELDTNKFLNKIYSNLNENSTIYEALCLANSYYNYLANCMIENNKTITQEKIDEQAQKLNEFLNTSHNNIINNLTILDEKDIAMIIKDRYKLLNFNIKQESFNTKNMDNLISLLENIVTSFRIKRSGLKVQNIEEIIEIKDTLK